MPVSNSQVFATDYRPDGGRGTNERERERHWESSMRSFPLSIQYKRPYPAVRASVTVPPFYAFASPVLTSSSLAYSPLPAASRRHKAPGQFLNEDSASPTAQAMSHFPQQRANTADPPESVGNKRQLAEMICAPQSVTSSNLGRDPRPGPPVAPQFSSHTSMRSCRLHRQRGSRSLPCSGRPGQVRWGASGIYIHFSGELPTSDGLLAGRGGVEGRASALAAITLDRSRGLPSPTQPREMWVILSYAQSAGSACPTL